MASPSDTTAPLAGPDQVIGLCAGPGGVDMGARILGLTEVWAQKSGRLDATDFELISDVLAGAGLS